MAVVTLAGLSAELIRPQETETGVEVQLDSAYDRVGSVWVRWRCSETLGNAALEAFRQRRDAGRLFDPAFIAGHPLTEFDKRGHRTHGGDALRTAPGGGFEVAFGENDYAPHDVHVLASVETR
jgi:hypothetical protein